MQILDLLVSFQQRPYRSNNKGLFTICQYLILHWCNSRSTMFFQAIPQVSMNDISSIKMFKRPDPILEYTL